jgi:hypothetical protein
LDTQTNNNRKANKGKRMNARGTVNLTSLFFKIMN